MISQWSCEENEIIDPLDNNITENQKLKIPNLEQLDLDMIPPFISDKLSKFQKSSKIKSSNFGTILPNSTILKVQKRDSVSYTFLLSNDNSLKKNEQENIYIDNLVFFQNGKSESTFIIRYIPEMYWYKGSRNFSNYSGKVEVFDDEGERIGNVTMDDGVLQPQNTTKTGGGCELEFDPGPIICTELIDESGDSYGLNCTQTYDVIITCSSSGGGDSGGDYDPNNPPGGDNPGEFPDGPGQGGVTPPNFPEPEEDEEISTSIQVDEDLIGTCAEDIIKDFILEDFSNAYLSDPLLNEVFDALTGSNSPINIIYLSEDINGNGLTGTPTRNNTTNKWDIPVTIDLDLMNNGTKLAIAKTILHESVHAYLEYIRVTNPSYFSNDDDFSSLVNGWNQFNNLGYAHHTYMGNLISQMGQQLAYYSINYMGYPSNASAYPTNDVNEYFEYVAWSGIAVIEDPQNENNTILNPVFISNYSDPLDQITIINTFISENTGESSNGVTPLINNNCDE